MKKSEIMQYIVMPLVLVCVAAYFVTSNITNEIKQRRIESENTIALESFIETWGEADYELIRLEDGNDEFVQYEVMKDGKLFMGYGIDKELLH